MKASVREAFYDINVPWEGVVPHFYQDVKGLITIGVGNLCDPVAIAANLPMLRSDGSFALREEIIADWHAVKSDPTLARLGHRAAAKVTVLHMAPDDIKALVCRKLDQNVVHLKARFLEFDEWCADAQMAVCSLAWACGPAFRFPLLEAALKAKDFHLAATECDINEAGNPGVAPRNVANKLMLKNAARVEAFHLDPERLWYPSDLAQAVADTPTEPELPSLADDDEPPESPTIHDSREIIEALVEMRRKERGEG